MTKLHTTLIVSLIPVLAVLSGCRAEDAMSSDSTGSEEMTLHAINRKNGANIQLYSLAHKTKPGYRCWYSRDYGAEWERNDALGNACDLMAEDCKNPKKNRGGYIEDRHIFYTQSVNFWQAIKRVPKVSLEAAGLCALGTVGAVKWLQFRKEVAAAKSAGEAVARVSTFLDHLEKAGGAMAVTAACTGVWIDVKKNWNGVVWMHNAKKYIQGAATAHNKPDLTIDENVLKALRTSITEARSNKSGETCPSSAALFKTVPKK